MPSISALDRNFRVSHTLDDSQRRNLRFYDIDQSPFSIYGVFRDGETYVRMPKDVSRTVSAGVHTLASCCSGGRVRFVTDSRRIAIRALCPENEGYPYFAQSGVCGLDLYMETDGVYQYGGSYAPPFHFDGGFEGILDLQTSQLRCITIHLPLYNPIRNLFVGLDESAVLQAAPVIPGPPVVYYGSSITQGGCASRPGCSYQAMIHQQLNIDYVNLGFSGNALAEETMMHYLAGIPMSAFVYDYDYNAPDPAHLEATHFRGYQIVRRGHPDIPIFMLTRPKYHLTAEEETRNSIVRTSYERAVSAGDQNVHFIDGRDLLLPSIREYGLADNVHPNDMGFYSMAQVLLPKLRQLLFSA